MAGGLGPTHVWLQTTRSKTSKTELKNSSMNGRFTPCMSSECREKSRSVWSVGRTGQGTIKEREESNAAPRKGWVPRTQVKHQQRLALPRRCYPVHLGGGSKLCEFLGVASGAVPLRGEGRIIEVSVQIVHHLGVNKG